MAVNWKERALISGPPGPHRQAAGVSRAGLGITRETEGHSRLGWVVGGGGLAEVRTATAELADNLCEINCLNVSKTYPKDNISNLFYSISHL